MSGPWVWESIRRYNWDWLDHAGCYTPVVHLQIFPLMGKNEGWGSTSSNWRGSKVRELVVNNDFPTAILWTITSILPPVTNHFLIFEQERGNWGSEVFIPSQVRVSCCLLPTQLFISPRVQTRTQDRALRGPTNNNNNKLLFNATVFNKFSPHQYSTRTRQFYMIWKAQHEMNTDQKTKYSLKSTVLWFSCCWMYRLVYLYFFEHISFGIFVHKFKLQLHRAYCW